MSNKVGVGMSHPLVEAFRAGVSTSALPRGFVSHFEECLFACVVCVGPKCCLVALNWLVSVDTGVHAKLNRLLLVKVSLKALAKAVHCL